MTTTTEPVTYNSPTRHDKPLPTELTNLREVDEAWMARDSLMRCYQPDATGIVRVESLPGLPKTFGGYLVNCFHQHDGTGVVLHFDYHAQRLRWFAYGCQHETRGLSQDECRARNIYHGGRCFHVSECTKCGHINAVDSSD